MPPLTMMIKPVSGSCNMRCSYCFYMDEAQNREAPNRGRMSQELLETLVRRAFAYADGEVNFAFQGGEPTLAGEAFFTRLAELQRKYNGRGLRVHNAVQTNGYDLPDGLIDLFARERFLVGVSVDGDEALHDRFRRDAQGRGTYARVMENIGRLQAARVEYNVLCVVDEAVARSGRRVFEALAPHAFVQFIPCLDPLDGAKQAYSLTPEGYMQFLNETFDGYERAYFTGRYVSVRNFDNYISILMGRQPESCAMRGRCETYYLIESDGDVYPCDFYALDEWKIGNVARDSFARLEKSPVLRAFQEASYFVDPACRACRFYGLCRGGCRREREPFVQGRPGLNRLCEAYKAFFEGALPRLERIARDVAQKERI